MSYKLYQGVCMEIMDKLIDEGVKVDAIITDPPYGITAYKWDSVIPFNNMWSRLNKLIKTNGAIVLFGSQPFTSSLIYSNMEHFKHQWIWDKGSGANVLAANYQPLKVEDEILVFTGKGERVNYHPIYKNKKGTERYVKNIINISIQVTECTTSKRVHPTQKPVELLEYLIKTYTDEGSLVLDFTMGSGSTGVACMNTNRNFIGIELDENYFNIAKDRIESIS